MGGSSLSLALVAGEASGDLLAALMLQGLKARWPQLQAAGIGGPRMVEQGFDAWAPSERLSVFGYVEAIKRLPELLWLRRRTRQRIQAWRPDVFVGVDAPDFNFGLETALRRSGQRTVHFVCPSIWAWRPHRVKALREAADHVLCLFPFEPELLASHGVAATYVGHPLADLIPLESPRDAARAALGLASDEAVVALLPGSRRSEILHIAPVVAETARELVRRRPALKMVLPVAPGLHEAVRAQLAPRVPDLLADGRLVLLQGRSHEALAAADAAVVASGTATLEAALMKCPMVIVYRLAPADWHRMRKLRLQPWVGLPNILWREFVVPERIQDEAEPARLAQDVLAWLDDPQAGQAYRDRCHDLHRQLRQGTGQRAAQALQELLGA